MPFSTKDPSYSPSNALPQHLGHKPVYALPYEHFDGIYTDIKFISVGIAQYNNEEVSIKTMRHTGRKWTRQAEELPIHRSIDMTLFLAKAIFGSTDGSVDIPKNTFKSQDSELTVTQEKRSFGEMASYDKFLSDNSDDLKKHFNNLRNVLNDLKDQGKI
uniref:Uncharacterized protein n=1 Tax=uncultured Thiotrichaceae bacterium TaxID=298394 RepID=A0A6S6UDX8_9GAMM|nr:MAG: Unknown protein [uncultured Thiotrichaceae bacterium]